MKQESTILQGKSGYVYDLSEGGMEALRRRYHRLIADHGSLQTALVFIACPLDDTGKGTVGCREQLDRKGIARLLELAQSIQPVRSGLTQAMFYDRKERGAVNFEVVLVSDKVAGHCRVTVLGAQNVYEAIKVAEELKDGYRFASASTRPVDDMDLVLRNNDSVVDMRAWPPQ